MRIMSRLSNVIDLVLAAVKLAASIKKERKPSEGNRKTDENQSNDEARSLKRRVHNPTSRR